MPDMLCLNRGGEDRIQLQPVVVSTAGCFWFARHVAQLEGGSIFASKIEVKDERRAGVASRGYRLKETCRESATRRTGIGS